MDILLNQWYSPIIGLIGIAIGIISIPLSIFLYRKGQRLKKPCWSVTNTLLIEGYSSSLVDLAVTYKDRNVENLSVSRIAFWNDGRETIDKTDIANANPLRIQARDGINILDAKIIQNNNESSTFSGLINEERTSARINFEYIDHNQGVVIQIVHTGISYKDLTIEGDIKGSNPPKRRNQRIVRFRSKSFISRFGTSPRKRRLVAAAFPMFVCFFTITMAVWMFVFFLNPELYKRVNEPSPLFNIVSAIFFTIFGIFFFRFGYSYLRTNVPESLELFEEDILPSEET